MSTKRTASEDPPAMSTRSKRARLSIHPQQRQRIAVPEKHVVLESVENNTTSNALKSPAMSQKQLSITTESQMPTPSLTPSPRVIKSLRALKSSPAQKLSPALVSTAAVNPFPAQDLSLTHDVSSAQDSSSAQHVSTAQGTPSFPKASPSQKGSSTKKMSATKKASSAPQTSRAQKAPRVPKSLRVQKSRKQGKQKMTAKHVSKALSLLSDDDLEVVNGPPKTALQIAEYWYNKCGAAFTEADGFDVTAHDEDDGRVQRVVVWEKELYDKVLQQRPGPRLSRDKLAVPDPSKITEKDCDFTCTMIQPPDTIEVYEKMKTEPELRDIAILVIECRGADTDTPSEWRQPHPMGLSRSYSTQSPRSKVQDGVMSFMKELDDVIIGYETKGFIPQEQCFAATAIGDKIKFWRHVSPYPHMKKWSGILDRCGDEAQFNRVVDIAFDEVKTFGWEFSTEMDGRMTYADA